MGKLSSSDFFFSCGINEYVGEKKMTEVMDASNFISLLSNESVKKFSLGREKLSQHNARL